MTGRLQQRKVDKIFVSENATKAQTDAVVELLPLAEGFFEAPVREVRDLSIPVERTENKVTITAKGTRVGLEQIRNAKGEPIRLLGPPAKGFPGLPYLDHTQYRTVVLNHLSEEEAFEFSGSNGYTAKIDASNDREEE